MTLVNRLEKLARLFERDVADSLARERYVQHYRDLADVLEEAAKALRERNSCQNLPPTN